MKIVRREDFIYYYEMCDILEDFEHIGSAHFLKASEPLSQHRHQNVLEIVCLERGTLHYEVENYGAFDLQGGDIFIAYPNELHSTGIFPQGKTVYRWIAVVLPEAESSFLGNSDLDSISLLKNLKKIPKRICIGTQELWWYLEDITNLLAPLPNPVNILKIKSLLILFLYKFIELNERSNKQNGISPLIQKAIRHIQQNYNKKITLSELAKIAKMSESTLKRRFKIECGTSPNDYILHYKIKESKALLKANRSITEIAFELSFSSSQHFSNTFRKLTGKTPSEFKKMHYGDI